MVTQNCINFAASTTSNQFAIGLTDPGPSSLDVSGNVSIGSFAGSTAAPSNGLIVSGTTGIGTSAPASILHIYEDSTSADATAGLTIENDGTGDAIVQYLLTGGQRWVTGIDNSDSDKFKIASSADLDSDAHLVIDTSGNVGVGETTPTTTLHIKGASGGGDPTTTTTGDVVSIFENNNQWMELGVTNTGNDRRAWILARHSDIASFGGYFCTLHLQPDISGSENDYQGVAIAIDPSNKLDSTQGLAVGKSVSIGSSYAIISAPTNGMIVEGNVGIGTSAPSSSVSLHLYKDYTGSGVQSNHWGIYSAVYQGGSGTITNNYSLYAIAEKNDTGDVTNNYGIRSRAINNHATGSITSNIGLFSVGDDNKSGVTTNYGAYLYGNNQASSGSTPTNYGAYIRASTLTSGGGIGTNHGLYVYTSSVSGSTITTNYGLRIADGHAGTVTNAWSLYNQSTADSYFAGNVGIGITTPEFPLHLQGDTPTFRIENTGSNIAGEDFATIDFYFDNGSYDYLAAQIAANRDEGNDSGALTFRTRDGTGNVLNTALYIDHDAQVGIGTTAPESPLHIYENTASPGTDSGLNIQNIGNGDSVLHFLTSDATKWSVGSDNDDSKKFKISNGGDLQSGMLTIETSGDVGIGTTSPATTLDVNGTITGSQLDVPGCIVQMQSVIKTSSFTSSSTSWTDWTDMSVNITPHYSDSKIYISFTSGVSNSSDNCFQYVKLVRVVGGSSTDIAIGDTAGSAQRCWIDGALGAIGGSVYSVTQKPLAGVYMDSPATTSAVTYKLQVKRTLSGTASFGVTSSTSDGNRSSIPSTLVLMEVAQ